MMTEQRKEHQLGQIGMIVLKESSTVNNICMMSLIAGMKVCRYIKWLQWNLAHSDVCNEGVLWFSNPSLSLAMFSK